MPELIARDEISPGGWLSGVVGFVAFNAGIPAEVRVGGVRAMRDRAQIGDENYALRRLAGSSKALEYIISAGGAVRLLHMGLGLVVMGPTNLSSDNKRLDDALMIGLGKQLLSPLDLLTQRENLASRETFHRILGL